MPVNEKDFRQYRLPRKTGEDLDGLAAYNRRTPPAELLGLVESHLELHRAECKAGKLMPTGGKRRKRK